MSELFIIKSVLREYPGIVIVGFICLSTIVFSYQIRITEGPIYHASGVDFNDLNTCMWYVIITLTNVGYGDIFPTSFWGKIVGIIVSIWGIVCMSFLVILLDIIINFSEMEIKACTEIEKLTMKQKLKELGASVLSTGFRYKQAQ